MANINKVNRLYVIEMSDLLCKQMVPCNRPVLLLNLSNETAGLSPQSTIYLPPHPSAACRPA